MSGVNKYYIELETNVRQTLADVKSLQDRMDKLEGKEHKLDIGIDTEKLEKVISNLDKMLNSLGKGTGDFKQFEKLSDELKNIKKSLGSIDDKGISNLYNSINSIDKAMSSLVDKLQIVKKDANGNIVNTSQIGELANLFVKIEDHLNSIHKAFGEAGKDKGLSPLINQVNELKEAMSGLKLNLNLDLGDIGSKSVEQVSKAQRRQLEAYRSLFDKMKGTGKYTKEMMKFIEPEGLSDAELSGIYKQMIENAKKHYSTQRKSSSKTTKSNVYKDILGDDYEKEIKLSRDAIRRAEKSTDKSNVLSKIFGGTETDLTGVISQLETIANKLDTIASSAKTMGDAFSSGLNVSASLEEITKLTERVKELETELQKVKSAGGSAGIETDLSSGGSKSASATDNKSESNVEYLKNVQTALTETKKRLSELKGKDLTDLAKPFSDVNSKITELNEKLQNGEITLKQYQSAVNSAFSGYDKELSNVTSNIEKMVTKSSNFVGKIDTKKNNVFPSEKYKALVKESNDLLEKMKNIQTEIKNQDGIASQEQLNQLGQYNKRIEEIYNTTKKMTTSEKGSTEGKAIKEIKKIYEALDKNTRMSSEAKAQLHSYINELKTNPAANVEEIAAAWKKVIVAEKEAGRGGKSLFSAVGEKMFYGLAGQIANMVSLYDVINLGKQAVNQIIELDTALVDLQKTTTMSSSQLNQFYYDANDVAKQMGVTTQEIIEQASAWSRFNKIDPLYSNVYRKPSQIMGNPIGRTIMRVMWKLLI